VRGRLAVITAPPLQDSLRLPSVAADSASSAYRDENSEREQEDVPSGILGESRTAR